MEYAVELNRLIQLEMVGSHRLRRMSEPAADHLTAPPPPPVPPRALPS